MKLKALYGIALLSAILSVPMHARASGGDVHLSLLCTDCHETQPLEGQPVDFRAGGPVQMCAVCHHETETPQTPVMRSMSFTAAQSLAAESVVNRHPSSGSIPEAVKQWMIQWYTARGLSYGDPSVPWNYGCGTCHKVHNAPYPYLLAYTLEDGELCSLCHGGSYNTDPQWISSASRRVVYGPDHLGLVQSDGITELPAPPAPKDGDVVSGTVSFPLAAFSGFHRTTEDIAYRISIPGSMIGSIDVNPSNYLYWYMGAEAASWDTTQEANGEYVVSIIPSRPSTLVDASPLSFTLTVSNLTTEDRICALGTEISDANIENKGIENSMLVKAANACKAVRAGNTKAAGNILKALLHEIEAQRGKALSEDAADALIESIQEFLALLQ